MGIENNLDISELLKTPNSGGKGAVGSYIETQKLQELLREKQSLEDWFFDNYNQYATGINKKDIEFLDNSYEAEYDENLEKLNYYKKRSKN